MLGFAAGLIKKIKLRRVDATSAPPPSALASLRVNVPLVESLHCPLLPLISQFTFEPYLISTFEPPLTSEFN